MISLIEALNYRSLRYVRQPLSPFQILIGPNGSGKTALLEVPSFLAQLIEVGVELAMDADDRLPIPLRATDPRQLLWKQQGQLFELAVECPIPATEQVCRYELAIDAGASSIVAENLLVIPRGDHRPRPPLDVFPSPRTHPLNDPGESPWLAAHRLDEGDRSPPANQGNILCRSLLLADHSQDPGRSHSSGQPPGRP